MLTGRAVVAASAVARTSAVSAFRAHDAFFSTAPLYHSSGGYGTENEWAPDPVLDWIRRREPVLPITRGVPPYAADANEM